MQTQRHEPNAPSRLSISATLALTLAGCGDPRLPFVGSYTGTGTETTTFGNGSTSTEEFPVEFTLTAPPRSDRLEFGNNCMFTAVPVSADTFEFDAVVCPTRSGTANNGVRANYTSRYDSGTGSLTHRTLKLTQHGSVLGSDYADGTPNQTFPFRLNITATRE